jgi:hypothetical protein
MAWLLSPVPGQHPRPCASVCPLSLIAFSLSFVQIVFQIGRIQGGQSRTGLTTELKETGRYSPPPRFVPDQLDARFSPPTQRRARESATASGESHLT